MSVRTDLGQAWRLTRRELRGGLHGFGVFLGERDPGAGVDPWAALAAMPHVCAWRDAQARGDRTAAAAAAAMARDFAGHDTTLPATLPAAPEPNR